MRRVERLGVRWDGRQEIDAAEALGALRESIDEEFERLCDEAARREEEGDDRDEVVRRYNDGYYRAMYTVWRMVHGGLPEPRS